MLVGMPAPPELHGDVLPPRRVVRDSDDDYVVALTEAAVARLVTGDDDLLAAEFHPPALTPRALTGPSFDGNGRAHWRRPAMLRRRPTSDRSCSRWPAPHRRRTRPPAAASG